MNDAQAFVDEWWRNPARDTFFRVAAAAARRRCGAGDEMLQVRHAFIRMAEAIRVGDGHAFNNPEPLTTIVAYMLATAEAGSTAAASIPR
jgi:hypothetical protein